MLTANKIIKEVEAGRIFISDFNLDQLNPNSYNVRLRNCFRICRKLNKDNNEDSLKAIDSKNPDSSVFEVCNTNYGDSIILMPGDFVLGATQEVIASDHYISAIDGRSSIGRLGIQIHATAGFGDIGFKGTYTLEISNLNPNPVILYSGIEIAQVYFEKPDGIVDFLYNGRYNHQVYPTESKLNLDSKTIKGYHYNDKLS